MTLDSRFQPLATQLLQTYGKAITFKRITQGVYNPATGSVSNTITNKTVYTYLSSPDDTQLASGQYLASQVIAMLSAEELGFEPTPNDKLTIDGYDWNIARVSFVSSGENNALYYCVINK